MRLGEPGSVRSIFRITNINDFGWKNLGEFGHLMRGYGARGDWQGFEIRLSFGNLLVWVADMKDYGV